MSTFKVEVCRIERLEAHPNADLLELAYLEGFGYQFVVGKGLFSVGQKVIYFPVDAVLPESVQALLGLPKNRVKSIRLRGAFSEGVLSSLDTFNLLTGEGDSGLGADLSELLGVTKYEPPYNGGTNIRFSRPDELYQIPVYVYDLENAQRYPAVIEKLQDIMVVATEKLEGSNWWARLSNDVILGSSVRASVLEVGQRRFGIKPGDEWRTEAPQHPWWKALRDQNLDTFLYRLASEYPGYDITIRGEIIGRGIQGNYYNMDTQKVYLFEIELNDRPVDAVTFQGLTHRYNVCTVPTVFVGYMRELATDAVAFTTASSGNSALILVGETPKLREGLVVRPLEAEMRDPELGRVILKARDPIYLAGGK